MKLGFVLAPLLLATTAHAQAPGEFEEGTAAPGMVAPVVEPTPPPPKPRRWSVGLGFGSLDLAPHGAPEAETSYSVAQLAVRYLATRHFEIELAFGGGEDASDTFASGMQVDQAVLALRYRFNPQRKWNFWIMAGMGSLAVTHEDASDEERDAAEQSTLQFGAGVERRFHRFALQLELRAVGVKAHDYAVMADGDVREPSPDGMTTPPREPHPPGTTTSAGGGMAGGQVVFSGNYYF